MLTSVQNKTVIKKGRKFIASLLLLDLLSIFKRDKSWKDYNSLVYIWCINDNKITHLGGNIYIRGTPIYVGFTAEGNFEKIKTCRATNHNGDLLDFTIQDGYYCYCICGLSKKEAHWLEAHFINALGIPLTERGCYKHKKGTLINKKRESKPNIETYPENEWK